MTNDQISHPLSDTASPARNQTNDGETRVENTRDIAARPTGQPQSRILRFSDWAAI